MAIEALGERQRARRCHRRNESEGRPKEIKRNAASGQGKICGRDASGRRAAREPAANPCADVDHPRHGRTTGRRLAARDQVRRLPDDVPDRRRQGAPVFAQRQGLDAHFGSVAADLARIPLRSAWIDGEVVVLDATGRSSFQALQNALSGNAATVSFFAFDLVYREGYDLRGVVLAERKRLLREAIGDGVGVIRVGPEVRGRGDEFFRQACSLSLEGAVCKRTDSLYHRRHPDARMGEGEMHAPAGNGYRRLYRAPGIPIRFRRTSVGYIRQWRAALCGQGRHRIR